MTIFQYRSTSTYHSNVMLPDLSVSESAEFRGQIIFFFPQQQLNACRGLDVVSSDGAYFFFLGGGLHRVLVMLCGQWSCQAQ